MDDTTSMTHVETVVLLSQQKPDDTIEIDLDLDELEATSAETKATYQEIKDYVLKEFGLKVSNLYISQIKRKCGIEVGENYNLPKTENPKVPQCPKEKEDAIKAALKYFAMIYGIYYPNLVSTDEEPHYGKYGMMRKTYLKEHRPAMYSLYMLEDRLTEHLNTVDDEAQKRMDILVRQMMERQGITEELNKKLLIKFIAVENRKKLK